MCNEETRKKKSVCKLILEEALVTGALLTIVKVVSKLSASAFAIVEQRVSEATDAEKKAAMLNKIR
jgi:hypothetical protein